MPARLLCGWGFVLLLMSFAPQTHAATFQSLFEEGTAAYRSNDFPRAADLFSSSASVRPASGTLENLGLAEWRGEQPGPAILA